MLTETKIRTARRSPGWGAGVCVVVLALLLVANHASAWSVPAAPMRRSVELKVDSDRIDESNTARADFFAPGMLNDGADLRLMTDSGDSVPIRVLSTGPDDAVSVVFNPPKGKTRYFVYWGSDKAQPARPGEVRITSGLLVEVKRLGGGQMDNVAQLAQLYERSGALIGSAMIDRPFFGYNPARIDGPTISRITGTLYAPDQGEYQIALSADDRGGLRLDGKDFLMAPGFPNDIRFNKTITLTRGPHAIEYFHVDHGADWRVSMGWRAAGAPELRPMHAENFGKVLVARTGLLEVQKKPVAADLSIGWLGECIVAEKSSFRVRFEAKTPDKAGNVRAAWDFGDGQTGQGIKTDHVYLKGGTYSVTLDLKSTQGNDRRTFRVQIGRDPDRVIDPALDEPRQQCDLVGTYDFAKLNAEQQVRATRILARGKAIDPMLKALSALCATKKHDDQQGAIDTLAEAIDAACDAKREKDLPAAMANLTPDSNLQPKAADLQASVLLWRVGDFKSAAQVLEKFRDRDSRNLKRLWMQALLLDGRVDEARKVLEMLPHQQEIGKRVALSGALARSIEFFIDDSDPESASEAWDDWQRQFPESFWEGYSALLKVRMLEPKYPLVAAKVAESFALAVPTSAYAPQLLDRASKILAKRDKEKSDALRKLLKEKYPEDPLSQ